MKKKILLTGGNGFIGHNLALFLKNKGYEVTVLDSLGVNNILSFTDNEIINQSLYRSILNDRISLLNKNNINIQVADARDYHLYSKIYSEISPDIVIHLAAVSHANKSNKDPHNTFDHSLRTLENSLDVCRLNKTHLIYFSSSMVYGNFDTDIVSEETPCNPLGIYGNLKYAGELIVKSYNQVFDLPYTIIRPSALYGERCVSRRVGQVFIENLVSKKEILLNGDGEDKLDFTYIEDLADGVEKCCNNKNAINQTFNLTFGKSRQIKELIEILRKNFQNIKIINKPREAFMPERGTLSIDKARELLNYQPQNPIEVGYQKYIDWYKNYVASNNI
jgi:nucleoside-diphosphate-sugar epimerase